MTSYQLRKDYQDLVLPYLVCKLCDANVLEDLSHVLLDCEANNQVGTQIIDCVAPVEISNYQQVILLQMDVNPTHELATVWCSQYH